MVKIKVEVEECDNPECLYREETTKAEPALGYYFVSGYWHLNGGGGPIPRVFACSSECIAPAVNSRIDET